MLGAVPWLSWPSMLISLLLWALALPLRLLLLVVLLSDEPCRFRASPDTLLHHTFQGNGSCQCAQEVTSAGNWVHVNTVLYGKDRSTSPSRGLTVRVQERSVEGGGSRSLGPTWDARPTLRSLWRLRNASLAG